MPRKGQELGIKLDFPGLNVVACHEPAIVVEQHLGRDAAKMPKRAF
jgi:hypothetical protein